MKKLPTYAGIAIFVTTLLINWLLPSVSKVLNSLLALAVLAWLFYLIYYWVSYWIYVRKNK